MPKTSIKTIRLPDDLARNSLKNEQQKALEDLLLYSNFRPLNDNLGPYDLDLSIQEGKLVIEIANTREEALSALVLSLGPYRKIIRDYFLMIGSYNKARHNHTPPDKLEAIDMARRSLHNEGADLLRKRLQDKIEMDHDTARRFFTLICALHRDSAHLFGS